MCGIIGIFNKNNATKSVIEGLKILKNRGRDSYGIITEKQIEIENKISELNIITTKNAMGHALHSIVGNVKQPIKFHGKIVANCEIYNWKELNVKYKLNAKNDAEVIIKLIEKKGIDKIESVIEELDGDFAFCYWNDEQLIIARDLIGVKPLFYSYSENGFSFCSEKKVLEKLKFDSINELIPRKILKYDIKENNIEFINQKFYQTKNIKDSFEKILSTTEKKLIKSIEKRIPNQKFGILFSGGVDSSVLALICKKLKKDFVCYTVALDEPTMTPADDLIYAKKVAKELDLNLKVIKIKIKEIPELLKKIIPLIEDSNVTKVGVALTFFPACKIAKKDGIRVMLSGLGSEEIFAGYQRHKNALGINKECVHGLLKMHERDLYRDDVISMQNSIELRVPFLDKELIKYALTIPGKYKIKDKTEKYVLRVIAEHLGLGEEFAWRKKKAAQYGSKTHRAIEKLTKRNGFKLKSEYLKQFFTKQNLKLGALVSGGKDSLYAMQVMQKQNYEISCFITIKSQNPDSYMFHTPGIDIVDYQAKALSIPMIVAKTRGIKEKELNDLKVALKSAQKKHQIDGLITGALYSTYQRDRIEKICDELGLKSFSPLWHIDQEEEMRAILKNKFKFILTSVAADGLNKSWLNKIITSNDIDNLNKLNKKIGLNIAGEGGEFESLVLDMPEFNQEIKIVKSKIVMENECTGRLLIEKVKLVDKK
jgi:diphthine-ammonia ligase